ncbi:MAG: hypothetical protein NDJ75_03060, partial [Thermoanaerobaculia bacterium]|nr:hypothetical protein [Thermoanaerobaculia bacterium]
TLRERIEALLWPWSAGHVEAGYLADWRELAGLAASPQTRWPPVDAFVARRHGRLRQWLDPTVPLGLFRDALFPNLLEIARNLQYLDASEQLGALAVGVARARVENGALPAALDDFPAAARPDAATAERPSYRLGADGAIVELRSARARLERALAAAPVGQRHVYERRLRLLRWRIPHDGTRLAGDAAEPAPFRQETP